MASPNSLLPLVYKTWQAQCLTPHSTRSHADVQDRTNVHTPLGRTTYFLMFSGVRMTLLCCLHFNLLRGPPNTVAKNNPRKSLRTNLRTTQLQLEILSPSKSHYSFTCKDPSSRCSGGFCGAEVLYYRHPPPLPQ